MDDVGHVRAGDDKGSKVPNYKSPKLQRILQLSIPLSGMDDNNPQVL